MLYNIIPGEVGGSQPRPAHNVLVDRVIRHAEHYGIDKLLAVGIPFWSSGDEDATIADGLCEGAGIGGDDE